jgi:leucyl aminopeptidase
MATLPKISFVKAATPRAGSAVVFADGELRLGPVATDLLAPLGDGFKKAAEIQRFKGKARKTLDLVLPAGTGLDRILVVGTGSAPEEAHEGDLIRLGATIAGKLAGGESAVTVLAEDPNGSLGAEAAADLALGVVLRSYKFDRYKTKKKPDEPEEGPQRIDIAVADPAAAKRAWRAKESIAEGVMLARDLVNEPPNTLSPEAFADKAKELKTVGVEVEVLNEAALRRIGMRALLGVGQGSDRESRVVVMRWNGARNAKAAPAAIVGKGVVFDSGGISIKPAGGMEDMKGDMAGAACVVGLMHALAARKARVNAVGIIGLVENMPDGKAQRPGDIVTTLSGQTIEIINTDAEGRLVLADLLWYVNDRYKPKAIVDLATLTGAILVALGQEHAGLFSNDDALSAELTKAGLETGERVWRLPLGPEYDKMIDSKFADMKNTGGRHGGSITAAQLLQRFVGKTPWAHLDIAGTAMGSPQTDLNKSWGSGWGVRLLDRWIADTFESAPEAPAAEARPKRKARSKAADEASVPQKELLPPEPEAAKAASPRRRARRIEG